MLQSWAWGEAGAGEPGEHWSRLIVVDGGGHIRGVAQVLDRATSFGRTILYVPHGPLWDREAPDAAEVLARLLTGLKAHAASARASCSSSTRVEPAMLPPTPPSSASCCASRPARRRTTCRHRPRGSSTCAAGDDPVAGWCKDARAEARRAEREGTTVTVDRDGDPAVLDAFHALAGRDLRAAGLPHPHHATSWAAWPSRWRPATTGSWPSPSTTARPSRAPSRHAPAIGPTTSTRPPRETRSWPGKRGPYAAMAELQRAPARGGHGHARPVGRARARRRRRWTPRGRASASSSDASGARRCAIPAPSTSSSTRPGTASATCASDCAASLR